MFSYEYDIGSLLRAARLHFFEINHDKNLTEADKQQLKRFYLENIIAPRVRKILEKHLAHEMQGDPRIPPDDSCRSSPSRSHAPVRIAGPQHPRPPLAGGFSYFRVSLSAASGHPIFLVP